MQLQPVKAAGTQEACSSRVGRFFLTICGNRQMASMDFKFEVARFDGIGNFGLWRMRVKDLLAQQGISRALNEKKPA